MGMFVVWVTLILLILALVINGGVLFAKKRQAQRAADAGALAAASLLPGSCSSSTDPVWVRAQDYAITRNATGGTQTCTSPYNGNANKVKVDVTIPVSLIFSGLLGFGSANVKAKAVASATTPPPPPPPPPPPSGAAALLYAHSQTECDAVHFSGSNNTLYGAVWSNAGVNESGSNFGAPPKGDAALYYGQSIDTSKCLTYKPSWSTVEAKTPIDWPVPPPTLTFGGPLGSVTKVNGIDCTYLGDKYTVKTQLAAGLYCAASQIQVNQSGLVSNNVGFIAPEVTWSSGTGRLTGYIDLTKPVETYAVYGGLLFDAYGTKGLGMSGSSNSWTGAIFAPTGNAQVSGGGSTVPCGSTGVSAASCGFIEGETVQISGSGGTWQGLGPSVGSPTPPPPPPPGPPPAPIVSLDE
jgi:hypothetical protein